jgi:hypothetical protein
VESPTPWADAPQTRKADDPFDISPLRTGGLPFGLLGLTAGQWIDVSVCLVSIRSVV